MNSDYAKANILNKELTGDRILSPKELESYIDRDVKIRPEDLVKIESNPSFRWKSVECEISHHTQGDIDKALKWLNAAPNVLISAGAGMSVSSGIPTFEDVNVFEESDNDYVNVVQNVRLNTPDQSYIDLLKFVQSKNYFVFTSNVDCFFSLSEFDRERIYECHGNADLYQCKVNCSGKYYESSCERCKCGSELRPSIMKYGDKYWNDKYFCEQEEKFERWLKNTIGSENPENDLVILEIGCGTRTPTVRDYDDLILERSKNVRLVRINLSESVVEGERAVSLNMKANEFINLLQR